MGETLIDFTDSSANATYFKSNTDHYWYKKSQHVHEYSEGYALDGEFHWKECACGEKISVEQHDWTMTKSTQVQTVYECAVCKGTKEYNLELGAKYSFTTIDIIIPETLSMEELQETLQILHSAQLPREVAELVKQIEPIDTVEKYKTVLTKCIETGELKYYINNKTRYLPAPLNGYNISVTDDGEFYNLTMFSSEDGEASEKVAKTEDSSIFYQEDSDICCFFDGKIQFKFEYLKGIKIIYNFEIV